MDTGDEDETNNEENVERNDLNVGCDVNELGGTEFGRSWEPWAWIIDGVNYSSDNCGVVYVHDFMFGCIELVVYDLCFMVWYLYLSFIFVCNLLILVWIHELLITYGYGLCVWNELWTMNYEQVITCWDLRISVIIL